MSPIYQFYCHGCSATQDEIRLKVGDFSEPPCNSCGGKTEHVISAPTMHVWNKERRFPNIAKHGDGTMAFPSKRAYRQYLKDTHQGEFAHDAPIERPHGNKVIAKVKL